MDRLLLKPSEAAELLGIGRSRVYELLSAGVIPSIRIGTSVRVPLDSLRAWIASQTDDAASEELATRLSGR